MAHQQLEVTQPKKGFARLIHYIKKIASIIKVVGEGLYAVYGNGLYKHPHNPENVRYVQWFCRRLCQVFNIEVQVHGQPSQDQAALWVSNHVSWLDIPVLGSGAKVFFLAKAEIEKWPLIGKIAKGGGTLFIKRGSGDSGRVRDQITDFLTKDIPVLFFPEATTTDGTYIKRIHGRLLGAALEAKKPVQVVALCYVNQQGELDHIAPYVGELSFAQHVMQVLEMPKVTAHLIFMPLIEVDGHTIETLTEAVQHHMEKALSDLKGLVVKQ